MYIFTYVYMYIFHQSFFKYSLIKDPYSTQKLDVLRILFQRPKFHIVIGLINIQERTKVL